jgi:glycosyltransferase involved in cell wall biosynthesis
MPAPLREIAALEGGFRPGEVRYEALPRIAALADVLIMPYAGTRATQTIQPLKLKEYLATGKPVVIRNLPATREWADAADLVDSADAFAAAVAARLRDGVPDSQRQARLRLRHESWEAKARQLESIVLDSATRSTARPVERSIP